MRRAWVALACLLALGGAGQVAAEEGKDETGPSLEYRPPKPILPEPKGPTPAPPVTVFRESFGTFGIGRGSFDAPVDVASGCEGRTYVLDAGNNRVQLFDKSDNFLLEFGSFGTEERRCEFDGPTAILVVPPTDPAQSGRDLLLVLDTGNDRILWFKVPCGQDPKKFNFPCSNSNSLFNKSTWGTAYGDWGMSGISSEKFNRPLDFAVDEELSDGLLFWVLDSGNDRVQRFKLSYESGSNRDFVLPAGGYPPRYPEYVDQISNLSGGRGDLRGLVSLAPSYEPPFRYLYLLGTGCSIQKFKAGDRCLNCTERYYQGERWVLDAAWPAVAPESDLCVPARVRYNPRTEYVHVLDAGNGLVSIFHRGGNFIGAIRSANRAFDGPRGLSIDPESGEFTVADTGNDLVQRFTLR